MNIIKKAGMMLVVAVMLASCFFMEYYTYQSQETLLQMQKGEIKEQEKVVSGTVIENEAKKETQAKKVAYLTFDDGPSKVTERILDVLKVYDVKATFFLVGQNITSDREELVQRMVEEGNVVGIHTYCHEAKEIYCSADAYMEDLEKTEERIYEVTGEKTKLCRFPWGSANQYLKNIEEDLIPRMENQGYYYCDWNVSAEDSVGTPTKYSIIKNVKKDYNRYEKPVILMHDSATSSLTAEMLPDIIVMLKDSGYQFDTLNHVEKPYQYPRN